MSSLIKFGEIPGINEGNWFKGRKEMMSTSFHRKWAVLKGAHVLFHYISVPSINKSNCMLLKQVFVENE